MLTNLTLNMAMYVKEIKRQIQVLITCVCLLRNVSKMSLVVGKSIPLTMCVNSDA